MLSAVTSHHLPHELTGTGNDPDLRLPSSIQRVRQIIKSNRKRTSLVRSGRRAEKGGRAE